MVDHVVLVNGLPGSGKTTLATALAEHLRIPLISKDAIKEAVADVVPAAAFEVLGRAAAEMMWALAAEMTGTVLVETWWFTPRDRPFVSTALRRCAPRATVEVWCQIAPELARGRYAARRRHPVHDDQRRLTESWPQWAAHAAPLNLGPTLYVDTHRTVDVVSLAQRITALLAGKDLPGR